MTKSEIKAARERIARYREVPYGACRFVTEQFKVTLDKFQEQTLMAWVDPTAGCALVALADRPFDDWPGALDSWRTLYRRASRCGGRGGARGAHSAPTRPTRRRRA